MNSIFPVTLLRWLLVAALVTFAGGCTPAVKLEPLPNRIIWSGTVVVDRDLVFAADTELVLEPGTEVVFAPALAERDTLRRHPNFPGYELIIHGRIVAEGTAERPIVFRFRDPDAPAGSWGGINLVDSEESRFSYCLFAQADSAVHSQRSTVYVEQSIFERNLVGVRFHDSRILVEQNLFEQNGTAIRFHFGAPVICLNLIRDNEQGMFITSYPRDYHIENNAFVANRRGNVILGEEVPDDVLMPRNYWGMNDPEQVASTFYDGQRDDYIGRVRILPLLQQPAAGSGVSWSR